MEKKKTEIHICIACAFVHKARVVDYMYHVTTRGPPFRFFFFFSRTHTAGHILWARNVGRNQYVSITSTTNAQWIPWSGARKVRQCSEPRADVLLANFANVTSSSTNYQTLTCVLLWDTEKGLEKREKINSHTEVEQMLWVWWMESHLKAVASPGKALRSGRWRKRSIYPASAAKLAKCLQKKKRNGGRRGRKR